MTTAGALDPRVDRYLADLEAQLGDVTPEEKTDIVREIRAHIVDSLDGGGAVEPVLAGLGAPRQLVERYRTEVMLTRASQAFSPCLLLRTAWRWAFTGFRGMVVFLIGVCGYLGAFAMTLAVVLKPFSPSIGLWVGPGAVELGVTANPTLHEVLGHSFIPVITLLAFGLALATTQLLRWLMRLGLPRNAR